MNSRRAHIVLPDDLLAQIDELVGSRGRSQFIAELARAEVHRRRLLKLLEQQGAGWKLENHPELQQGAASWVDSIRREDEKIDAETHSR
jgi:metal-responsive CopG/Arc/MetJ family transcriptional regulator